MTAFLPMCRFDHNTPAVARYSMSKGCYCYPDDKEQDLCAHHESSSLPHGTFERIAVYPHEPQQVWKS